MSRRVPRTKFCISLDLDESLLSTQEEMKDLFKLKIMSDPHLLPLRNRTYTINIEDFDAPGAGTTTKMWGVLRPHAKEFIAFCCDYFEMVNIYTAGTQSYAEFIADYLFKDLPPPHIIYSREQVEENEYREPVKPIVRIARESNGKMTLKNTFHLDDRQCTFEDNPDNGILITEYRPTLTVDGLMKDDDALLKLMDWFMRPEVLECEDVRSLEKDYIFDDE